MADGAPVTRVHLLGPLRATIDGAQVDHRLPGRRGRALFALLVLNRERALTRDEVIGHLWPQQAPSSPDGALSTLLTRLRQAIGPEHLEGRSLIALRLPADAWIDVERLGGHVSAARAAFEAGNAAVALREAAEATRLSADALLPELDEPWVAERRRDAADAAASALELHARAALSLGGGELSAARTAARRLIEREPYRESGYALLMEAHARAGDDAEALRVFEQLRVLLRDELGTHPSSAVTALHQRVLEGSYEVPAAAPVVASPPPAAAPAPPQDGPARAPVPLPPVLAAVAAAPFVGRDEPLTQLRGHWDEATAGRPLLALVTGEPGIGKTSLVAHFASRLQERGATVLSGQCDEHSGAPFQPIAEALRRCVRHSGERWLERDRDPALAAAGTLVPELRHRLPEPAAQLPGEPDTDRYQLFEAARLMIERAGDGGPVLLVVEDVHWADRSTLLMLRHIVREAGDCRLMVVASCRDTEAPPGHPLHDAVTDLDRLHALRRVALAGLSAAECRELVRENTSAAAGADQARRWYERTDGHPLFLRELLRAPAAAGEEPGDVPAGVGELIAHRVQRLGEGPRATLEVAAVIGRRFTVGLLSQLTGQSLDATIEALEEALAHGLVDEVPGGIDSFSFHHELVREALSARHSRSRRARLHARIGAALEQSAAAVAPAELAHHFFEARHVVGPEPALRHCTEAARAASRALAYEEAAEHYRRALRTLDELGGADREGERCELLIALGEEQRRAGDPEVERTFAQAAASARERGDRHRFARAALAGRYAEAGLPDDARVTLLQEALAALGDEDSVLRVTVLARLGAALNLTGACESAQAATAEALELARRLGDPEALIAAITGRHESLAHVGDVQERLLLLEELIDLGHKTGNPNVSAYAHQWSAFARLELGDFEAARVHHGVFAGIAGRLHLAVYDHSMLAWAALFAQLDARLADAERIAFEGFGFAERVPGTDASGLLAAQLCFIRREQGRLGEILPAFESFVATSEGTSWNAGLAAARAAGGQLDGARELLRPSAAQGFADVPPDVWWLCTMALFAEAAAQAAERDACTVLYRLLEPYADRHVQVAFTAHLGSVHRVLALLAGALGDRDRSLAHFEAALERHLSTGARTLILRSQCDLACALVAAAGASTGAAADARRARALELVHQALIGSRETDLAEAVDAIVAAVRRDVEAPRETARPGAAAGAGGRRSAT